MAGPSNTEPELLPCPFCGGVAKLVTTSRRYDFCSAVECQSCGVNTGPGSGSWGDDDGGSRAIALWNRRASPPPTDTWEKPGPAPEVVCAESSAAAQATPAAERSLPEPFIVRTLPADTNVDKLADAALALLSLNIYPQQADTQHPEAATEIDYTVLLRLHQQGMLAEEPNIIPGRSVRLTPEGARRARELFRQLFCA